MTYVGIVVSMLKHSVMRFLCLAFVIGLMGCTSGSVDLVRAKTTLVASAQQGRQAMLKPDHQLMAELTLPAVVKGMGGRERFTKRLAEIAAEMTGAGFSINDVVLSESSEIIESNGILYAIVPFKLHVTAPGKVTGIGSSYLICVSDDGGNGWKFIDGDGIAGDRSKLLQVIPGFPEKLALPPTKKPEWKR